MESVAPGGRRARSSASSHRLPPLLAGQHRRQQRIDLDPDDRDERGPGGHHQRMRPREQMRKDHGNGRKHGDDCIKRLQRAEQRAHQ